MRRMWVTAVAVLAAGMLAPLAHAADHQDGPIAKSDPSSDITDVFAWMSAGGDKVYLVMDVFPAANKSTSMFSTATKYVFHAEARDKLVGGTVAVKVDIICTFDASQKVSCWAVDKAASKTLDYVNGDASMTSGLISMNSKMKVFTGPRDDPFFFNLDGFKDVASTVHSVAGTLTFDANGCPAVDANTSALLVKMLSHTMMGSMPPVDHFKGLNVLAIVVAVDKTLLTSGSNTLLSVWASTNK